jgi:hypothetical protein
LASTSLLVSMSNVHRSTTSLVIALEITSTSFCSSPAESQSAGRPGARVGAAVGSSQQQPRRSSACRGSEGGALAHPASAA